MFKVCFLQSTHDNEEVLNHYKKMTPNRSGKWKEMVGTTSIEEADYVVIIDYSMHEPIPKNKPKIYIGAHPQVCRGYYCFDEKEAIIKMDLKDTFGFGEWWLDEDYDTLSALKPPKKTKDLSCILSNGRTHDFHKKRIEFMVNFCSKYSNRVDLYGRIKIGKGEESLNKSFKGVCGSSKKDKNYKTTYWNGKRKALEPYRYSLEFDNGSTPKEGICRNYFSERFFDSMLMWCMPIYYGGIDIHKFIPINAFRYIDIFNDSSEYVINIIESDFREQHLKDIAEARYLLLNKYQIWSRVYLAIKKL